MGIGVGLPCCGGLPCWDEVFPGDDYLTATYDITLAGLIGTCAGIFNGTHSLTYLSGGPCVTDATIMRYRKVFALGNFLYLDIWCGSGGGTAARITAVNNVSVPSQTASWRCSNDSGGWLLDSFNVLCADPSATADPVRTA